jgi:hypothetical protein
MTEMDTLNNIENATKPGHWTALWLDGEEFALETPADSSDEIGMFARSTCVSHVHDYIKTELAVMAEASVKSLLECRLARAESLAHRLVDCKRDGQSRDLGYSEAWTVSGYHACTVAAVCICKAKHHASYKNQNRALEYAQRARGLLGKVEMDKNIYPNMFWAAKSLQSITEGLCIYTEEACTT